MTDTVTVSTTTTATVVSAADAVTNTVTLSATASATATAYSTTTTTQTTTVTIEAASSTAYAACAANNIVNSVNGAHGIFQIYYIGGSNAPVTNEIVAPDAQSCCEACQQLTGCTGYAKYPGQTRCFLFTNGLCDGSMNFGQFFQSSASFAPTDGYTAGNGQCGQLGNGGNA